MHQPIRFYTDRTPDSAMQKGSPDQARDDHGRFAGGSGAPDVMSVLRPPTAKEIASHVAMHDKPKDTTGKAPAHGNHPDIGQPGDAPHIHPDAAKFKQGDRVRENRQGAEAHTVRQRVDNMLHLDDGSLLHVTHAVHA